MSDSDWDQLVAELESEDPNARVYDSSDYPSEEAAMKALEALLLEAMEEGYPCRR